VERQTPHLVTVTHSAHPFGHVQEPSWEQVMARSDAYEPWRDEPIELSGEAPVEDLIRRLEPELGFGQRGAALP